MFADNPVMRNEVIVDSKTKLRNLVTKMKDIPSFAFDTETNTLRVLGRNSQFKLVAISISWGADDNYYIPVGHIRGEDVFRQLELEEVVEALQPIFSRTDVTVVGWNLKFDLHVLKRVGLSVATEHLHDAMIMSWLCNENEPQSLKYNSNRYLNISQTKFSEVIDTVTNDVKKMYGLKASNKATFDLALIEDAAPYALADSFYTWELYKGFLELLATEKMNTIYRKIYMPFIRVLFEMEERGVNVDVEHLTEMEVEMKADIEALQYEIIELAGVQFNPSSNVQLAELLFGHVKEVKTKVKKTEEAPNLLDYSFGFPIENYTNGGNPSTDNSTIWSIANKNYKNHRKQEGVEMCKKLLEYKKLDKLYNAFVVGLREQLYEDMKVHPSFNITGTDSGRLSCSSPNLQQLPNSDEEDKYQIRSLFVGSKYYSKSSQSFKRKKIISIDFSNLEMRVLAHFSQDKNLLTMFEQKQDTHGSTAVNMFELDCDSTEVKKKYPHLRQAAKTINFMLMYGGGSFRLYNSLKEDRDNPINLGDKEYLDRYKVRTGEQVAQIYIDKYFSTYSGVADFISSQKRYARRNLFVYTVLQRKRRLPDIRSNDYSKVSYCERLAVNSTVQGSAADITINAQLRIAKDKELEKKGVRILIQVHDELVFECPEHYVDTAIEKLRHYMEHPFGDKVSLNLPLVADAGVGDNYQQAK